MTEPRIATQSEIRAAQLFEQLYRDPELGATIRKRAKAAFPDISIPEDTVEPALAPLTAQLERLAKQNDELRAKTDKREAEEQERSTFQSLEQRVNGAVAKFSLTEEGKAKMLDRMKETGNYTDPEASAAFIAHSAPKPAALPSWAPKSMNLFGAAEYDEQLALLHRNPEAYADAQLLEFAKDPEKYVAETFGNAA